MPGVRGIELDLQLCNMILLIHKVSFSIRASGHASIRPRSADLLKGIPWRYPRAQFGFGAELGLFPRPIFPVPIVKSLPRLIRGERWSASKSCLLS